MMMYERKYTTAFVDELIDGRVHVSLMNKHAKECIAMQTHTKRACAICHEENAIRQVG